MDSHLPTSLTGASRLLPAPPCRAIPSVSLRLLPGSARGETGKVVPQGAPEEHCFFPNKREHAPDWPTPPTHHRGGRTKTGAQLSLHHGVIWWKGTRRKSFRRADIRHCSSQQRMGISNHSDVSLLSSCFGWIRLRHRKSLPKLLKCRNVHVKSSKEEDWAENRTM